MAEEAGERWIGFWGVGSVSKGLGMERAAVLVMLWHPKITALFKPRKKDPTPPLLGSRIEHPALKPWDFLWSGLLVFNSLMEPGPCWEAAGHDPPGRCGAGHGE